MNSLSPNLTYQYQYGISSLITEPSRSISAMSPVAWQHMNMYGSFEFSEDDHDINLDALTAQYVASVPWRNATQPGQRDPID